MASERAARRSSSMTGAPGAFRAARLTALGAGSGRIRGGAALAVVIAAVVALLSCLVVCRSAAAVELPDTEDVFSPPQIATDDRAGAIADGLKTAGPGEFLTLAGDFSQGNDGFEIFGQTTAADAYRASVKPVRIDADTAVLALPDDLPPRSTYLIWPRSRHGFGKLHAVNRTEAWWIGPQDSPPGRRISIFGRNLVLREGGASVFVATPGGRRLPLPVAGGGPYRLDVVVPDLPPGTYDLWTHNGGGGRLGWSGPLRLKVGDRASPEAAPTIDVRAFGARGDGAHDDGPAIDAALAAAAARAPATLYFPPGLYAVGRALAAPAGVRWLGAGRTESVLRLTVPLSRLGKPALVYSFGAPANVAFERLSIEADGKIEGSDRALVALNGSGLRFRDVRLSSWGGMTLRLSASDVVVEDGEIVGAGSFLASSSQVFVSGVTFRMTTDGEAALSSWGGREVAVRDSLLVNADESRPDGSGIGRLFVAQPHFGSVRDLYFAGNATRNSAPRDCAAVDCNKGEQIILEFSGSRLQGRPSAIGRSSVTFSGLELPESVGGFEVVVAGGKGLGQHRRVVSASNGTLTLDRPWDVTPDIDRSRFFVTAIAERVVVQGNRFEGRQTHSAHDSNSTAVLVWGLCFDVVVADNDISRMRHGVMAAATSGAPGDSVSAPFFTLVENNRIREGRNGLYTGLTFGYDTDAAVSGGVGNVFRKNDIQSMSHVGVAIDTWDTSGGDLRATVFERNRIRDVRYAIVSSLKLIWSRDAFAPTPSAGTRLRQAVLHSNVVDGGPASGRGSVAFRSDPFQDWVDVDGVWEGRLHGLRPPVGVAGAAPFRTNR